MARHKTKTTSKTHTNRTTGARAATGSSAFPALSLTADTVGLQTGETVAAKHPCWIDKGMRGVQSDSPMRRHSTRSVKGLARTKSTRTPTLTKIAIST